jgi:cell division protein FtsL
MEALMAISTSNSIVMPGFRGKSGVKGNVNFKGKGDAQQPVVRLRSVFIGICVLSVCMAGPLALVWMQSYINQISLRIESKNNALAEVNRSVTALVLERGHLSAPARIERIARSRGLDYPASGQIEVWEVRTPKQWDGGLLAYAKRVLFGGDKSVGPL